MVSGRYIKWKYSHNFAYPEEHLLSKYFIVTWKVLDHEHEEGAHLKCDDSSNDLKTTWHDHEDNFAHFKDFSQLTFHWIINFYIEARTQWILYILKNLAKSVGIHIREVRPLHAGLSYQQGGLIWDFDSSIVKDLIDSEDPKHTLFCHEIAFVAIYALFRDDISIFC